jgi:hypothetical protein
VTYTWTADTENPEFTACPTADIPLGCNPAVMPDEAAVVIAAGSVTDKCTVISVVAVPGTAGGTDCEMAQTWTVTATDECGRTAVCFVTYTWTVDTEDPEFTACPTADIPLGCNPATMPNEAAVVIAAGMVTDNCTVISVVAVPGTVGGTDCDMAQTWTVTATDECGRTAVCFVTYTWTLDTEDPEFTACPTADIALGCNPAAMPDEAAVVTAAGMVTDNCTVISVVAVPGTVDGADCYKTQTWTVTATDECGRTAVCFVTYIWTVDTEDPSLNCPGALMVVCSAPAPYANYAAFFAAGGSASDNCGINETSFTWDGDQQVGNIITRPYKIEDNCGNMRANHYSP